MILETGSSVLKLISIKSTCHNYKLIHEYITQVQISAQMFTCIADSFPMDPILTP